jgi:hypothetical protein
MWEFSVFRALGVMIQTLPALMVRAAVCSGIAVALLLGAWAGAMIGQVLGNATSDQAVLFGMAAGLVLVAGFLHLQRDLLLHRVKARHLALMVEALDRRPLPFSPAQIGLAHTIVTERLADAPALGALDRLVRGVIRTATRMVDGFLEGLVPIAFLDRIVRATGLHLLLALPLIDGVILAHAIRTRTENAWEAAHDGLVLYTQNARPLMANALWLSVLGWGLAGALTLTVLSAATDLAVHLPAVPSAGLLLAFACAWAVKSALYDPFALACLLQLHLRLTREQEPLPEWRGRLTQVSDKFRILGEHALGWGSPAARDA